jgi:hypothetical protein
MILRVLHRDGHRCISPLSDLLCELAHIMDEPQRDSL